MKSQERLLWFALLSLYACQFDRRPLFSAQAHGQSGSTRDAGWGKLDAQAPLDAEIDARVAPRERDAAQDAAILIDDDGGASGKTGPHDPNPPPMNGGLKCQGTFCPFAIDPAVPCCTTKSDVQARTSRAADRCGYDLSALQSNSYGTACWQRDQLGIVDSHCPDVVVEDGKPAEPGCCADDGQCGTVNSDQKLGCRHAPGTKPMACGNAMPKNSCDPSGSSFGIRVSVDMAWGGRSGGLVGLTDDGRGAIQVYVLANIQSVDPKTGALTASGRVCGVTLPPFYSTTLCEAYQPIFGDQIWESSKLPAPSLTGNYQCGSQGCVLSLDPYTYLLGISLENPQAPWPTSDQTNMLSCPEGVGARCFPDHDDDGAPGVLVSLLTMGMAPAPGTGCSSKYAYKAAPLNASVAAIFDGVRRTDRMQLGMRIKLGGSSRFNTACDAASGSGVAEFVNSRAIGCNVQEGTFDFPSVFTRAGPNDPCNASESHFLDQNLPEYILLAPGQAPPTNLKLTDMSASHGPEVSMVRLGAAGAPNIDCAMVRDAKY